MRKRNINGLLAVTGLALLPAGAAQAKALEVYLEGDPTGSAPAPVSGGLLLMGGGDHDIDAMRWFIAKAGHGHIVILRASQHGEASIEFYRELGGVLSAETFVTHRRSASYDKHLLEALRKADGVFIAGGDQARYVRRWRGTPIAEALDAHVRAGKPLAGTSAGLAMLGNYLYGCMDGHSLTSPEGLADPYDDRNGFPPPRTAQRGHHRQSLLRARSARPPLCLHRQGAGEPPGRCLASDRCGCRRRRITGGRA